MYILVKVLKTKDWIKGGICNIFAYINAQTFSYKTPKKLSIRFASGKASTGLEQEKNLPL